MTEINFNKLLHTMLTDDCWHPEDYPYVSDHYYCKKCKTTVIKGQENFNYLADRRNTTMLILEEVPKRYEKLWKDLMEGQMFLINREWIVSSVFLSDFLNFSIEWFKAHDDKCEKCINDNRYCNKSVCVAQKTECNYCLSQKICPACQGTGHKWWKELKTLC